MLSQGQPSHFLFTWLVTTNTEEKDKNYCQSGKLKHKILLQV